MFALLAPTVRATAAGVEAMFVRARLRLPCRPPKEPAVSEPKESAPKSAVARSSVLPASALLLPKAKVPAAIRVLPA